MTVTGPALAPPLISSRRARDGSRILSCDVPLEPCEASVGLLLRRWATAAPERVFLAERDGQGGWATLSFAEASRGADARHTLRGVEGGGDFIVGALLPVVLAGAAVASSYGGGRFVRTGL